VSDTGGDGPLQVGARQDHVGGLAAEFHRDTLDRTAGESADLPADRGGAGERDVVDAVVLRERLAGDVAVPGHHVDHAGGQSGRVHALREQLRAERCVLGRLEDDRAAGGERGRDLADDHGDRVVPRRDGGDHADGFEQDRRVGDPLLERVGRGEFRVGGESRDRRSRLHSGREPGGRTELRDDRPRDLLAALGHGVVEGAEKGSALGGRGGRPARQRGARDPYRRVDVRRHAGRDLGDDPLVRRVDHGYGVRLRGGSPLPSDVHGVVCLHRHRHPPQDGRCGRTDARPAPSGAKLAAVVFRAKVQVHGKRDAFG
jgi:hypothetical protein